MSNYWTTWEYDECNVVFMEFVDMAPRVCNMWRYERVVGCMKNQLLGSFFEKLFWQQMRLNYDTFCSFIRVVGSSLEQKNTQMKKTSLLKLK